MYNYPVIECLVAFAIVFSIGFLQINQRLIAEWAFRQCEKGLNLQGMQMELEKIITGGK